MRLKTVLPLFLFLCVVGIADAQGTQKVITLPETKPSGALTWPRQERQYFSPIWNTDVVTNVSHPTLTPFLPPPGQANGTAVIICPGGGFRALSINNEGNDVAKWLNARGVTAFVLRYRLVPTGDDAVKEMMSGLDQKKANDE